MFRTLKNRVSYAMSFHARKHQPFNASIVLTEIRYNDLIVPLAVPLTVDVEFDGKTYVMTNDETSNYATGKTFEETMREFSLSFIGDMTLAERYGRNGNGYVDRVMYHVEGRRERHPGREEREDRFGRPPSAQYEKKPAVTRSRRSPYGVAGPIPVSPRPTLDHGRSCT